MALEIKNITKVVQGVTHIKPTTLTLRKGHFNVLLGETGAGKTSLIKMMAGLDPIAAGQIILEGEDVTALTTQKRNISLVHQFFVNYPHMTVFENIASPLKVAGMAKSEIEDRVAEAADILQLGPMLHRRPHELSGGQQQRCALARAIAKESRAVFLDEPLANLDYKLREELREQLPELFADRGAVVVYATSEPEEALLLGGETALMVDGNVAQFGPTADIYRAPASLTAARIFSDPPINHAPVTKRGDAMHLGSLSWTVSGEVAGLADGDYIVAVRPHHVLPHAHDGSDVALKGHVGVTELSGSESSAHFEFDGNSWVSLAHGTHPYRIGEDHDFYLDPTTCFYFAPDGARVG
ncbi:ABC transporter ATP-binding protein [Shimia sp. R11_0]|uniref:sn-glycerol-3-phosphate import ATP-binding protein UgpC n=1 Tax=Shimia marina TaxID=321267 RepID=A0A0P1ESS7_9RHOB|nr:MULTISPECIES: ABC transporter ATP-binding protein [Shimia]MBO9479275.1 ABC transporter ATP-binding protein [Shimia sp. R11_0]CUH53414.1 sn-glycerol-3-phosphate import ATP-binding protein UgpC [Shimia marina]SFD77561.1 carbohydrate ABC transporter ATP-binding protein, CUT1 family (TC 3.A.1.1.-) [Shimia marina]